MTIEYTAIDFTNASEAIQHVNASGTGRAILIDGKHQVVNEADAHRLEEAGIEFAYLGEHEMPDGTWRIVTVPVNPRNDE